MGPIKKRKHQIIDDDSDEDCVVPVMKKNSAVSTSVSQSNSSIKKKKRIVIFDSDDDNDDNENNSINDIKKNAKIRAKMLATGLEPTKSKSKTTPPSEEKRNNILNYFKPLNKKEEKKESNNSKKENPKKADQIKDDDGYIHTYVTPKNTLSPTVKIKSNQKETSKKSIHKKSNDEKEKPLKAGIIDKESPPKKVETIIASPKTKKSQHKKVDPIIASPKTKKSPHKKVETIIASPKTKNSPHKKQDPIVKSSKTKESSSKNLIQDLKKEIFTSPKKSQPASFTRVMEPKRISELWVDKYKPTSTKQIIGQQGDKSALNKLIKWLRNWYQNLNKKPTYGKWGPDDGAGLKAALLSGPPGIGKTTSAQLVCRELGYDYLELNASDTRNKKSLHENVRDLLCNTKLTNFFKSTGNQKQNEQALTARHCLIMDEIDGISGNEDRGGVAELIQLIKTTMIPIICICNDRGDQKVRTMLNYCLDLRFSKPKLEQIKSSLMSIAFKENIEVSPDVLNELIVSCNYDIRQCIHNLYLVSINQQKIGQMINSDEKPIKDVRLAPFDATRKVFCTGQEYAFMTFNDKLDLFFSDYNIMPLFIYENYLNVNLSVKQPSVGKQLKRLYKTIDSISYGDLIEKEIRTNQAWSLLTLQGAFSTVMPGAYMRSANGLNFSQFPQFMGKLSSTNKNNRIIERLISHMKVSINGSKSALILDYIQALRNIFVNSLYNLNKSAISLIIDLLQNYSLTKDDMDSILEFCLWTGEENPMKKIDSKTKSALTRAYNSKDFTLPYAQDNDFRSISNKNSKKKRKRDFESSQEENIQSDDDDLNFY